MNEYDRLIALSKQCRILADQAATPAAKDSFTDMALEYECEAEALAATEKQGAL